MKIKNIITVFLPAMILGVFCIFAILKPQTRFSDSERRYLEKFPELSIKTVLSGEFMKEFEGYTLDQFPLRDIFRGIKAFSEQNIFLKKDNNKVFKTKGHLSKIEYPLNENMIDNAADKFNKINDKFLDVSDNIYFSLIPDKNYFLATDSGYLHLDYNQMSEYMKNKLPYMEHIDLNENLSIDDYYYTDTHWKQENLIDVARIFADKLNIEIPSHYTENQLTEPFYGVYCGQYALPVRSDTITYLTNDIINGFKVTNINDLGKPEEGVVYDLTKAKSKDPYEIFLSGAKAVQIIENPTVANDRELVVFRDSFGASLLPLIAQGYSKTTLIDIRYVYSDAIGYFVNFKDADVLFLYSSIVLNNSSSFR